MSDLSELTDLLDLLDAAEINRGVERDSPRVKFIERDAFFEALEKERASKS